MTREDLTIALALALLAAAIFGVLLHLIWQRLRHGGAAGLEKHERMAERLHEAEEAQEAAETHMRAEISRIEAERAEAEAALHRTLAEREAELAAAMETVGALRRDVEAWQEAYEAIARGRT